MNVFRLVLCLAGLTAYLVVKQWLQPSDPPLGPAPLDPSVAPVSDSRQVASGSSLEESSKARSGLAQTRK
jgi:hypothetical protein